MDSSRRPRYPWPVRRVSDPKELRALAHPVRFALIDLLAEGPMTATQCGVRLARIPCQLLVSPPPTRQVRTRPPRGWREGA